MLNTRKNFFLQFFCITFIVLIRNTNINRWQMVKYTININQIIVYPHPHLYLVILASTDYCCPINVLVRLSIRNNTKHMQLLM